MTEQKVVAPDMRTALRLVKEQFGAEALIVDTSSRRQAREGSLRIEEEVEIRVCVPDRDPGGRLIEMDDASEAGPAAGSLEAEVARLERLVAEFTAQIEEQDSIGRYPLMSAFRELGLSGSACEILAADHAVEIPPFDQDRREPALARLAHWLPAVEAMAIADLRGYHALIGAAGVGRSAMARKLAVRCAAAGGSALLIACAPSHPGERIRLERDAECFGFEAVLAPDGKALLEALGVLGGRDLVILDLPAFAPGQIELLERVDLALGEVPLLRHLVLPADGHRPERDVARAAPHYLAISRGDLGDPLRVALELGARTTGRLSFLGVGGEPEDELSLVEPAQLLRSLDGSQLRADAAEAGGGR